MSSTFGFDYSLVLMIPLKPIKVVYYYIIWNYAYISIVCGICVRMCTVHMCVHLCVVYVRMYVCICMHVCMCVCMHVCMCTCVCMHVCMCMCVVSVCMRASICPSLSL